eukprot:TRINITY_DN14961_c0_g1_i7.p1 TRINITY_DN14961_c0_g1~~TRINITY_DN14961_c0_g1_i7.p1  ORF type:complete len:388 (+),score=55.73 TRINITY_DN14961_c0_g1_i7:104-1267(+)
MHAAVRCASTATLPSRQVLQTAAGQSFRALQPCCCSLSAPSQRRQIVRCADERLGRPTGGTAQPAGNRRWIRSIFAAIISFLQGRRFRSTAAEKRPLEETTPHGRVDIAAGATTVLQADIERLKTQAPMWLRQLSQPVVAPIMVDALGDITYPSASDGSWDVHATLELDAADKVYFQPIRVRLRFDNEWPQAPPKIRIMGLLSLPLVDARSRGPQPPFYRQLRLRAARRQGLQLDSEDEALEVTYNLADVLADVRMFLLAPGTFMAPLEGSADSSTPTSGFSVSTWSKDARRLNERRMSTIRKYRHSAKHEDILDELMPLKNEWFDKGFWAAQLDGSEKAWRKVLTEHLPGQVYSMPLFSETFCDMLLQHEQLWRHRERHWPRAFRR